MVKFVVVGSGFAGLTAVSNVRKLVADAEIVLISPSSKLYYNPPAPRILVEPEHIDKIFTDLSEFLERKNVKFIHDSVTAIDFDAKSLTVSKGDEVTYDYVLLASGTKSSHVAWKLDGDYQKSRDGLIELGKQIKAAKSVVIVGGGPTGVEVTGEIAATYPNAEVTLYTGDKTPLNLGHDRVARNATNQLKNLNVKIVNNVLFENAKQVGDKWELSFKDGSKVTTDVYVPTFGATPLTSYIPKQYLNSKGFVKVDKHLRVDGVANAYVFGDIVADSSTTIVDILYAQTAIISATLKHDLVDKSSKLKEYAPPSSLTILVPISKKGGVGAAFGWSLPSFLIKSAKSGSFFVEKAQEPLK